TNVDAGIPEVQRVRVTLGSITDDRDGAVLDRREVCVVVVKDFSHGIENSSIFPTGICPRTMVVVARATAIKSLASRPTMPRILPAHDRFVNASHEMASRAKWITDGAEPSRSSSAHRARCQGFRHARSRVCRRAPEFPGRPGA